MCLLFECVFHWKLVCVRGEAVRNSREQKEKLEMVSETLKGQSIRFKGKDSMFYIEGRKVAVFIII